MEQSLMENACVGSRMLSITSAILFAKILEMIFYTTMQQEIGL